MKTGRWLKNAHEERKLIVNYDILIHNSIKDLKMSEIHYTYNNTTYKIENKLQDSKLELYNPNSNNYCKVSEEALGRGIFEMFFVTEAVAGLFKQNGYWYYITDKLKTERIEDEADIKFIETMNYSQSDCEYEGCDLTFEPTFQGCEFCEHSGEEYPASEDFALTTLLKDVNLIELEIQVDAKDTTESNILFINHIFDSEPEMKKTHNEIIYLPVNEL